MTLALDGGEAAAPGSRGYIGNGKNRNSRLLIAAPFMLLIFIGALLLAAFAVGAGVMPDDAVRLWAGATSAGDGNVPIGRVVAAYPTLPFLATTLVALIAPDGTPAPALLGAALLALLAGYWLLAFRAAGLAWPAATAASAFIALHPALLRAAIGGPSEMFLAIFLFMLGNALYGLRARSATSEVMAVGLALLGLTFSHPMGAAVAFVAVPFLVIAVRPVLVASSALNVVVALVFPTVFAVGAFSYVSWVFPGAGWSFFAAPATTLAAWTAGMTRVFGDGVVPLSLEAGLMMLIVLVAGAPVTVAALAWVWRRRPLVVPALLFPALIAMAAAITVATGLFGDPTAVAVAAPALAALAILRVPVARERLAIVLALVALGWLGGAASIALIDPASAIRIRAAFDGQDSGHERSETLAAGGAMVHRDGVLVDTDNSPAIVLGRGSARGLDDPASEAFTFALLFARIDTPFVAVPDPASPLGMNDRLNKTFPALYRNGTPGYALIYQNNTWRLFARRNNSPVYKK